MQRYHCLALILLVDQGCEAAGTCAQAANDTPFFCKKSEEFNPCAVGGCPSPHLKKGQHEEGWSLRIEPCGDYLALNPAWGGLHMTMSTHRFHDDAKAKTNFSAVKQYIDSLNGIPWSPDQKTFDFANFQCAEEPVSPKLKSNLTLVLVSDPYLMDLAALLQDYGFSPTVWGWHFTLGYERAWNIDPAKYLEDPEFQRIAAMLSSASFSLVLNRVNHKTKMIERYDAITLRRGLPMRKPNSKALMSNPQVLV